MNLQCSNLCHTIHNPNQVYNPHMIRKYCILPVYEGFLLYHSNKNVKLVIMRQPSKTPIEPSHTEERKGKFLSILLFPLMKPVQDQYYL
jgi:hypothetical protein